MRKLRSRRGGVRRGDAVGAQLGAGDVEELFIESLEVEPQTEL
jgi:hypothetical protein